ncbi:hypothetical protein HOK68_04015 [Candidatus Woesearchaeota archaeon]|jgi:hypothetical protein|nr:hypothetical protein [Candidatus Woesearchaeota archaeon]MBT4387196.1 hypothetical protein [Candidatus Woesearchaeota archaeon]MBT4596198.1 hypothetical protein [Candidatus Woesearchaeota archaeon]MBT5741579.1 hypothetical protein [Candidatus Woesearchaeota archaeon]MBT6505915.1 hypothetical protein [Candidatus Woesearchaeota archaeon]
MKLNGKKVKIVTGLISASIFTHLTFNYLIEDFIYKLVEKTIVYSIKEIIEYKKNDISINDLIESKKLNQESNNSDLNKSLNEILDHYSNVKSKNSTNNDFSYYSDKPYK